MRNMFYKGFRVTKWLCLCSLFPAIASAQILGVSLFACQAKNFPVGKAISVFYGVDRPATAVLWGTFGSRRDCLIKFLSLKNAVLEIHLTNEACRRNRRCGAGEILPKVSAHEYNERLERRERELLRRIRSRVKRIYRFALRYKDPTAKVILSTGLEDNYTDLAYRNVLRAVKAEWPWELVRNPVHDGKKHGADFLELHGFHRGIEERCISNFDGTSTHPEKAKKFFAKRKCEVSFLWEAKMQGIDGVKFVPPRDRQFILEGGMLSAMRRVLLRVNGYGID